MGKARATTEFVEDSAPDEGFWFGTRRLGTRQNINMRKKSSDMLRHDKLPLLSSPLKPSKHDACEAGLKTKRRSESLKSHEIDPIHVEVHCWLAQSMSAKGLCAYMDRIYTSIEY